MGTFARGFGILFIIQAVYQVSSNPVNQYVIGPNNGPTSSKPNIPLSSVSNIYSTSSNIAGATPVSSHKPLVKSEVTSGPLDSNVLNNLAIALQLLIVSNIMNMPAIIEPKIPKHKLELPLAMAKLDPVSKYDLASPAYTSISLEQALKALRAYEAQAKPLYSYEAQAKPLFSYEAPAKSLLYESPKSNLYEALSKPQMYSYEAQPIPNANFVGSSGFSDPVFGAIGAVKPNPRSSMTLMSPYDALGTSSFADPLSSFPTSYSKMDFQSPYASILATDGSRDLFSMSDLF